MTIGWGKISLGKTVSSIGVPVTFRYHLRLSDPWRLAAKDHVCVVLPPPRRLAGQRASLCRNGRSEGASELGQATTLDGQPEQLRELVQVGEGLQCFLELPGGIAAEAHVECFEHIGPRRSTAPSAMTSW